MQIVEIRLQSGLLLIAKPGLIPAVMRSASDDQQLKVGLRTIELDLTAMAQIRRNWRKLLPAQSSTTLDGAELARRLRGEISAGRLATVWLREAPDSIEPAQLRNSAKGIVHVPLKNATLMLAPKGQLPPDLARHGSQALTTAALRGLDPASTGYVTLDRYAHRLPDGAAKQVSGKQLCHYVAWQVEAGGYDSALLSTPVSRAMAAARPDAPLAVSRMSRAERIGEAISRSRRHLTGEVLAAIEAMVAPESLAIMAAVFVAVAVAQINPATGVAVNTTLVVVAWSSAGIAGVIAIADLVDATSMAMTAEHDTELDEAAKLYAEAFVALGASLLSAIVAKFAKQHGGSPGKTGSRATKNQKSSGQGASGAGPQSNASKPAPRFGQRSKATEPGARPADAKTLSEIRRAKLRGNESLSHSGWPDIPGRDVTTFKKFPEPLELKPGQKIYRVIDQDSNPNGGYWTTDNPAKMTEAQWRSKAAVRGEWNGDGAFVEYEVPKGGLKVWSGEAAPQMSSDGRNVLSGGGNQLWVAQDQVSATKVLRDSAQSTGWSL